MGTAILTPGLRLALAFCFGVVIAGPTSAACLGKDPLSATKAFYRHHVDFYYADPAKFKELVSPALFKVLAQEHACAQGQECALDSDPWMNAQDGNITPPITYNLGDHDAAQETVTMHYVFSLSGLT
jgi:hypothetical protein